MSEILSQGAEAIITQQGKEVTKKRIEKSYRLKELDEKIRKLRTRNEAKLLERASKVISVPQVLKVNENKKEIIMQAIEGKRLSGNLDKFSSKKQKEICEKIGENIAKLHEANIIHGDFTTSNMILHVDENNLEDIYFIDFGLGFISPKVEDKAVDLHLIREAFEAGFANKGETMFNSVKEGYSKNYKDANRILERFNIVEKRGRYKQGS